MVSAGKVVGEPERPRIDDLTYRLIGGALCRAFHSLSVQHEAGDVDESGIFWEVVGELQRVFPDRDWRNIMTDSWPLGDDWPGRVIAEYAPPINTLRIRHHVDGKVALNFNGVPVWSIHSSGKCYTVHDDIVHSAGWTELTVGRIPWERKADKP